LNHSKMREVKNDAVRIFAVLWARRGSWTSARLAAREAGVAITVVTSELRKMVREGAVRKQRRGRRLVYKPSRDGFCGYRSRLMGAAAEMGLLPGPKMKPVFGPKVRIKSD